MVRGDVRGEGRMEDDVMGEGGGGGRGEEGVRIQPGEVEVPEPMVEVTRCGLGGSSEEALELRDMSPMLQQYLLSLTPTPLHWTSKCQLVISMSPVSPPSHVVQLIPVTLEGTTDNGRCVVSTWYHMTVT